MRPSSGSRRLRALAEHLVAERRAGGRSFVVPAASQGSDALPPITSAPRHANEEGNDEDEEEDRDTSDYGTFRYKGQAMFAGKWHEEPFPVSFIGSDRPMNGMQMGLQVIEDLDRRWLMI